MPMATPKRIADTNMPTLAGGVLWKVGGGSSAEKPSAREGHCSCVVKDSLYVFGGVSIDLNGDIHENGDLWKFDRNGKKWSEVKCATSNEKPLSRSAATMVSVGAKLYLFGGLNHSVGWLNDLFVFDTETSTWFEEDECSGLCPSARDKLCSAVIGEKIWFFGGFGQLPTSRGPLDLEDEEDLSSDDEIKRLESLQEAAEFSWFDDLFVYDTRAKSWSQPIQMSMGKPSPRCAASMIAYNNTLVIFGGKDADGRLNDLHFFDTEAKKWIKDRDVKGAAPACRSFHSATLCGTHTMVVTGGRSAEDQHFADCHLFNLEANTWTKIESTGLVGRGCHTLDSIQDKLLIFGGSSSYNQLHQHCDTFHGDLLTAAISSLADGGVEGSPEKIRKVN